MKNLKNVILYVAVFAVVSFVIYLVYLPDASGTNVEIDSASDWFVTYNPKCPECGHIGELRDVNISEGEKYEGMHMCEKCYKTFEITVIND